MHFLCEGSSLAGKPQLMLVFVLGEKVGLNIANLKCKTMSLLGSCQIIYRSWRLQKVWTMFYGIISLLQRFQNQILESSFDHLHTLLTTNGLSTAKDLCKKIWSCPCLERVKLLLWEVSNSLLNTMDRLQKHCPWLNSLLALPMPNQQ